MNERDFSGNPHGYWEEKTSFSFWCGEYKNGTRINLWIGLFLKEKTYYRICYGDRGELKWRYVIISHEVFYGLFDRELHVEDLIYE